jgi:TRAP-type C4-dicarboxylate transport system substrate-binding protein
VILGLRSTAGNPTDWRSAAVRAASPRRIVVGMACSTGGALAVAAVIAATCGCGGSRESLGLPDKAGGGSAPAVLQLAYVNWVDSGSDVPLLEHFADRARELSGGRVRIRLVDAEYPAPDEERRVAEEVRDGSFDLGWTSTRRWGGLGVTSFLALSAPFAIDRYGVSRAVARGALASRLLDDLDEYGVSGLALVPGALQHPTGSRRFASPSDFAGAQFLVVEGEAADAVLRELGAQPRYTVRSVTATRGRPAGSAPLGAGGARVQTANIVLYAKFGVLFVNPESLRRLSHDQRSALRSAAAELVEWAIARTPSERTAARRQCRAGAIALARRRDLAALRDVGRRVTTQLVRDTEARALLRELQALAAATPRDPAPASCERVRARSAGNALSGTYRMTLTKKAAAAFGAPTGRYPVVVTWTLRDGGWTLRGVGRFTGTYTVRGDRVAFEWPRVGYTNRFTYERPDGGTLRLRPVLPMDRRDQLAWSGAPWRRVAP